MDKAERGIRNIEKMRTITHNVQSKKVTFWNPTENSKSTITIDSLDARAIVLVFDGITRESTREAFTRNLATVSGLNKMLEICWGQVSFQRVA